MQKNKSNLDLTNSIVSFGRDSLNRIATMSVEDAYKNYSSINVITTKKVTNFRTVTSNKTQRIISK